MKFNIYLFILLIALSSCNNRNSIEDNFDFIKIDSIKIEKNDIYKKYQIPLPIEIFHLMYNNVEFKSKILKDIPNKNKDYSSIESAFNLGTYSADLAYCTLLENGQKTIDYSNVCGFFTQKMNIEDVYNKTYIERLRNNINNHDSLVKITNNAYLQSCNLIETRGMKNIIPFTIYGGWIETIYLAYFSKIKDEKNLELYKKSIIKKTNIDSLISYLYDVQIESSAYYYNKELKIIIFNLIELKKLFKDNYKKNINNNAKIEEKIKELYLRVQKE